MKKKVIAFAYLTMTVLCLIAFFNYSDLYHFLGAASMVHAFMFAVGDSLPGIALIAALWALILPVSLLVSYIWGFVKERFSAFLYITGIDLVVSGMLCGWKVFVKNYTDLDITLIGLAFRIGCYIVMVYCLRKTTNSEAR